MSRTLTAKRQAFVLAYIESRNATEAYLKVYGGTRAAARAHGARLVANGNVRAEIDRHQVAIVERAELTRKRVIEGLLKEAENKDASASARVAAWGKLAEIGGFNAPRQIDVRRISEWTADDLRAVIADIDILGTEETEGGLLPSPEAERGDGDVEGGE